MENDQTDFANIKQLLKSELVSEKAEGLGILKKSIQEKSDDVINNHQEIRALVLEAIGNEERLNFIYLVLFLSNFS